MSYVHTQSKSLVIHYITMIERSQIRKRAGIPYPERLHFRTNQLPGACRWYSTSRHDICMISPIPFHSLASMLMLRSEWNIFEILQNTVGQEFGFHDPSLMYLLKIRDELFPMVVARTLEHNANRFYTTHSQPTDRGMIG